MSKAIEPIPTTYNGIRFRSRLEARWAVFMDRIGIRYIYEPEGYKLKSGLYYLPDFWLLDLKVFVEVKPDQATIEELNKVKVLARKSGKQVCLVEGFPDVKCWRMVWPNGKIYPVLPLADQAQGENRFYVQPGYEKEDGTISPDYYESVGWHYVEAIQKAARHQF